MNFTVYFVLSFGCGLAVAGICPPDWHLFESKCYYAFKEFFSWADAQTACSKLETNLAVPSSISENLFIWELFLETFDQSPGFGLWVGISNIEDNGNWQRYQKDGDFYTNWGYHQPNSDRNCAVMNIDSGGKWGAQSCANLRAVVCARPPSSAPQVICFHTDGNGRLTTHQCLKHHVVEELRGVGVVSCGKACRSEPRCRSFSLLEQVGGKTVCQLNDATRHEVPAEDTEGSNNCYHFDI